MTENPSPDPHPRHVNRRTFLLGTGGLVSVAAIGIGTSALVDDQPTRPAAAPASRTPSKALPPPSPTKPVLPSQVPLPRPFTVPLPIPPVLRPRSHRGPVDRYEITQRAAEVEILPGARTTVWAYDGIFPGPTIESHRGRPVEIVHHNSLPVPSVVHLHGGHTPAESDGFPTDLVLPRDGRPAPRHGHHAPDPAAVVSRGSRRYRYPLDQPAATLWYHDHRMDFTAPDVYRGLAGFHLVHDDEERSLDLPHGARDLPLMIADRSFDEHAQLRYPAVDPSATRTPGVEAPYYNGVLGDVVLVNGAPWPRHEVDGARYRLRLLNASNARRYVLRLDPPPPGGRPFVQIGSDGGLLARPVAHDRLEIAPAERFDVVVDFARYRPGTRVTMRNDFGGGTTAVVMQFVVGRRRRDDAHVPARLADLEPFAGRRVARTRSFRFAAGMAGGMQAWLVGGKPFDPTTPVARPRLGDLERWRFTADVHHPVHVHLDSFQVVARGNRKPRRKDAGRKDTVDLRPGESADVLIRFTDHRGRYVLHCHNLEHEDMAMMATFETV